ncbi:MAG: glycosyltransferase [Vicinamibacterales bacterium]
MTVTRITILICTYNRARLLRETLAALRALDRPEDCLPEVLVVDNNSTDNTHLVIEEAAAQGGIPIVHLHETRQGKSFALNRGLAEARGDVIALTDDDVLPERTWLARIVDAFRRRDVTFVFGKVLPRWGAVPPPELLTTRAQDIWGPLAIVDYGDVPQDYVPQSMGQRLPIGANLAFSKSALTTIGGWRTDLGKVDNSLISGEDHEIFMRLRRFGLYAGYYDPALTVRHYVPTSRLTRRYFRQWFFWHGKTHALMLEDLFPDLDMQRVPTIAGVPRFLYRQAAVQAWRYLRTLGRSDALAVLIEELKAVQYVGLVLQCWKRAAKRRRVRRQQPAIAAAGLARR